ncbi:MAG: hypothetical protein IJ689_02635 [Alphaproteobacteria bacterium]|nr:hypothetical protein [Alphaproteobacteria bacterium]
MKNYILMLGIAGVALGSYCAYAGNSATMTVTATIAHDVSLTKTGDISLGTITINPSVAEATEWSYNDSGVLGVAYGDAIVTADNATIGTFTANVPDPTACNTAGASCGGLSVTGNAANTIEDIFDGSDNRCSFYIKHSESGNSFKVYPYICIIEDPRYIPTGSHSGTLTITYNN